MDKIYEKCCGMDVHKKPIVVCFWCGREQETCDFGATTRELVELTAWFNENSCEMAQWIAVLLQHRLLRPGYISNKEQRKLRELIFYRKIHVGECTRELNRL